MPAQLTWINPAELLVGDPYHVGHFRSLRHLRGEYRQAALKLASMLARSFTIAPPKPLTTMLAPL